MQNYPHKSFSFLFCVSMVFIKLLCYATIILRNRSCLQNLFSTHHCESVCTFLLYSTLCLSPFAIEDIEPYPVFIPEAGEQYLMLRSESGVE